MQVMDSAHVWHVAKAGNNANSGHAAQYPVSLAADAKLTIGAAYAAAAAGDTIIIWPGTYAENVSVGKALNLIGTHPSLCKASNFTFTSGGSGSYGYQLSVDDNGPSAFSLQSSDDVTLERCRGVTTGIDGLIMSGSPERVRLIECFFKSGYDGIQAGNCLGAIFDRCILESTGASVSAVNARALTATEECRDLLVKDCILRATTTQGVPVYGANIQGQATLLNCLIHATASVRTRGSEVVGVGCQAGINDSHALVVGGNIHVTMGSPTLGVWGKVGYLMADKITMRGEVPGEILETYLGGTVTAQVAG